MADKQKGDYPEIYDELIRIRRDADDGLTPQVIAPSPTLCRMLGEGSPYWAAGELSDRLSTAAASGDRAILAYHYSLKPGRDATARLTYAGDRLAVEYRRARDLSDQGALKLAQIIGSGEPWQVPSMGCLLTIRGWKATVEGFVFVTVGFRDYGHPRFLVDGEDVELTHLYSHGGITERYFYGPLAIDLDVDRRRIQMRRFGSPKIRVRTLIRSDNISARISSELVLLDYVCDIAVLR